MLFSYRAQNFEGNNVNGTLAAENYIDVRNMLLQRKLIVKSIKEVKERNSLLIYKRGINKKEMIFVFKNFSTMLKAGIPIIQAVDIMQEQVKQSIFKKALKKVKTDLSKGLLLSESIAEAKIFPTLVSAIVRIGEESGTLDRSFLQLSVFYLKQSKTLNKIGGALVYPVFTLLVAMGAVWYLTTAVLPTILNVLPDKESVGWPTKLLIFISEFVKNNQLTIATIFIASIILIPWILTTILRRQKDYWILKIPLYGEVIKKSKVVQFTTTLAILTEAGVNITDALDIIIQMIGNEAFRQNIRTVKGGVIKGEPISKNLSPILFEKLVITIVSIGESTGDMQKPLQDIAEFLDDEVDRTVSNMIAMITPISILIMAGIIAIIAVGVMGPMYSMYGSIG